MVDVKDIIQTAELVDTTCRQVIIAADAIKRYKVGMSSRPLMSLKTAQHKLDEAIMLLDQATSNLLACAGKLKIPDPGEKGEPPNTT